MNYNALFEELASNGSRLFKEDLLRKHKDDELLKRIFFMGLDPFTNYYIRKIPEYTPRAESSTVTLAEGLDCLALLTSREVTGHAAIYHLKLILEDLDPDDAKVIEKIIEGDFKCGVSKGTLDKIWPGLIKEYPVQLCTASNQKVLATVDFPNTWYAQLKMDGMRFNAVVVHGQVELFGRSGKPIDLLGAMDEDFRSLAPTGSHVWDGELWVADKDGKPLPRKIGNGILNKAIKGTISKEEAARVRATLWDYMHYSTFMRLHEGGTYEQRFTALRKSIEESGSPKIFLVDHHEVTSFDQVNTILSDYLAKGEEGLILKDPRSRWSPDRSKSCIKFKAERDAEMLCVGWNKGTGRRADKFGSLQLESSDGVIKVNVGSGLTDDDLALGGDYYVGKIVTIVYNERIKDRDGNESLFLPRFIEVRLDKTQANSSQEMK